ncbi:iron chaperone [Leifsonia sp. NPDC058248]|uniref:iron chaperone n=1 Tax=Leifsonia sp. NPDC058248 TaxID=3346402 RepID=UPI0036D81A22
MNDTNKSAKSTAADTKSAAAFGTASDGFTAEERAAIKERAKELKSNARRRGSAKSAEEEASEVQARIAEMADEDRAMAERIHAVILASAPELSPKLWYGMPGYAKNGKVVCFFQDAKKFKTRYSTLGFNDSARLDDGTMWPTSYALTTLTASDEERIGALVKKAAG